MSNDFCSTMEHQVLLWFNNQCFFCSLPWYFLSTTSMPCCDQTLGSYQQTPIPSSLHVLYEINSFYKENVYHLHKGKATFLPLQKAITKTNTIKKMKSSYSHEMPLPETGFKPKISPSLLKREVQQMLEKYCRPTGTTQVLSLS